ncbi:MAG: TPR repeat-containing protein [Candidatus Scalindua rubra]|uniref:TPR repeat-containing protein n=1 Tax=Candidatus Scalindua rubra TaxID=1872076 RepID=A0A1E3XCW4_9BACT|nr:MAG: TPR repeat-containing protein [Candidatus Scalindua rubra]
MKFKNILRVKKFSHLLVKILLVFAIVSILILQKNTISFAISILRVDPSVVELENQALYNLRRGKFLKVFKKCEELLKINKKSIIAYEMLGVAYAGIGQFDKAQEIIESLKDVTKNSPLLHLCKGMVLHSQKEFDKAIDECQKSIDLDQDNPIAFYVIGRIYIDKKEYDKAAEYLSKATENEPGLASAYTGLGINYLLQGKIGESFRNYNKALEINQDEHIARMGLAAIFTGLKAYENAIGQYNLVVKKIPTYIPARQNLASLYLQIGRFEDAIEQSNEILNIDSNTPLAYLILARSHSYTNNFDEAVKNIKDFINIQDASFEGNYLLGIFLMAKGDIESSKKALEQARKIDAKQGNILIANALINHIEGNYSRTENYLKEARGLTPETNHSIINIFFTNLYLSQNKYKLSSESLKKSTGFITGFRPENLVFKPDSDKKHSYAHTNLAIFSHLNRWQDKAITECDAALKIHPKNPITLYVKGKSLINKKRL